MRGQFFQYYSGFFGQNDKKSSIRNIIVDFCAKVTADQQLKSINKVKLINKKETKFLKLCQK